MLHLRFAAALCSRPISAAIYRSKHPLLSSRARWVLDHTAEAKRSTFAGQSTQDCDSVMKLPKVETLSIRTSADIKQLLRRAAEKEHRSIASMMEVLILNYAQEHGLVAELQPIDGPKKEEGKQWS